MDGYIVLMERRRGFDRLGGLGIGEEDWMIDFTDECCD